MRLPGRTPLVGAYVCPRGVFAVECRRAGHGLEVVRRFEAPTQLDSPAAAAEHLARILRSEGIDRANVAIAIRGFGLAHHVLQLPPADDRVLDPVVERETRRLEPQLASPAIAWIPLPTLEPASPDSPPQRSILAAAIPADAVETLESQLAASGYRLVSVTALPVAIQRLLEEFDSDPHSLAVVAPLPDGAFVGFSLNGGLRLVVEPPLPHEGEQESAALAEEVELGIMFVRQQFRGTQIDRIVLIGSKDSLADAETVLADRLHVPAALLDVPELTPPALAALGAVLDAESPQPLSLGGDVRRRSQTRSQAVIRSASLAAVWVLAVVALWLVLETVRTRDAANALRRARREIQESSFRMASVRSTAEQRRLVQNAGDALRLVADDRIALQTALASVADAVRPPVRIDSLLLVRGAAGWQSVLAGIVDGETSARAVQTLHDLYRDLPLRLPLDSLHLDHLTYPDPARTEDASPQVGFQFSFAIRPRKGN